MDIFKTESIILLYALKKDKIMVVVLWDKNLSVGVEILDEQHKTLINVLNDLYTAISKNKGSDILYQYFCEFLEHSKIHFACEEAYMQDINYSGFYNHKMEHEAILSKAIQHKETYDICKTFLSTEHLQFIRAWMIHHMACTDQKYVLPNKVKNIN